MKFTDSKYYEKEGNHFNMGILKKEMQSYEKKIK